MLLNSKQFNLPELEKKVLEFWKKNQIFEKSVQNRLNAKAKPFRFFEGPPTANGRPGTHHILSRSFKDIILRYKTMRGHYVLRKAGWDTHGLPVEIEVERELGLKRKSDIEKFGVAEFNSRARLSVWKFKSEWERLTERIGFWLDFGSAYITYENNYIETLWWIMKRVSERGLLQKLYKVVPWCPRCQTPLSNNELAQPGAYQKVKDPSVYVKFRLVKRSGSSERAQGNEHLLVWTTTPWTLPANAAVAVNPRLTYTKFSVTAAGSGKAAEYLWSFNAPPPRVGEEIAVVEKISGRKLVGRMYEPLYARGSARARGEKKPAAIYEVVAGDFVSTEEGTGIVHVAPAFGEDDFTLFSKLSSEGKRYPMSEIPMTVDERGIMAKGLPGAGKFIKDADKDIIADLGNRNLLYFAGSVLHEYPFCWRCSSPLIYFARLTWFIEISKLRRELSRANAAINWIPAYIKEGRFGVWLTEAKDWSISRERYWGTPLPIWEGESCAHRFIAGSYADLNANAFRRNTFFLVRHGEAAHNVTGRIAYVPENERNASRLTARGIAQAEELGAQLKGKRVHLVAHSPFLRARETARFIAKATGAKLVSDIRIGEIRSGVFNGRPVEKYHSFFGSLEERFTKRPPGGENLNDVRKRMVAFITELNARYSGKTIVVVSHADPLWVLDAALKAVPAESIKSVPFPDVGSCRKASFPNWPFNREGEVDFHRPYIDEIALKCPECGGRMRRVREVADAWFDSGAMPFASWHFPFENRELITKRAQFPADYIAEGVDQTRGWFYTLLAVSVLLGYGAPYKNAISAGLLLDRRGQKMSKSKGNVVDPWAMIEQYGADALRWYFYTVNGPGDPKKFDEKDVATAVRKIFLILYNSFVFFKTYEHARAKPIPVLDSWILARLRELSSAVTKQLDRYRIEEAGKLIEAFLDDFSRWYIRRSRNNVSPKVLATVLVELSKILAPFTPFFAEGLYQSFRGFTRIKTRMNADKRRASALPLRVLPSVHLEDWPRAAADRRHVYNRLPDKKLLASMAEVRRIASLALAEREKAGIKVRQPLAELMLKTTALKTKNKNIDQDLVRLLKDEMNVKTITFNPKLKTEVELDTAITPDLYEEGMAREAIRMVQQLRHDAGCHFKDLIALRVAAPGEIRAVLAKHARIFKNATKARSLELVSVDSARSGKFQAVLESKIDGKPIKLQLRKVK